MAKAPGSRLSTVVIPAPIGGWNARDALSEMKETDAVVLDNYVPELLGVRQRRGQATFATSLSGTYVEALMEYNAAGANPKLFAAMPNTIYDVSASGAGTSSLTSLSNGRWQHTMFATAGGSYLVCANGADSVRNYNGSSWSTPTITNVTSSSLITVTAHMQRLWFIQSGTLKVWYLPVASIAGAATAIDFAPLCKHGGELVAMSSWTRDGGSGLDDFAVFTTSKGEHLIYQGIDPSSSSTWGLVGIFRGPPPIGRRAFIKLGADLCYLSTQGVLPLPQFLGQSSAGVQKLALTDKISGAFSDAFAKYGSLFGWQIFEYPKEHLLLVNVPIRERAEQDIYACNLQNGSWCRWPGMNAACFGLNGDDLYLGGNDGKVRKYGGAGVYDDDGETIEGVAVQAFSQFGTDLNKKFVAARALTSGPSGYRPQMKMLMDFDTALPTFTPDSYTEIGPAWDEIDWDVENWGNSVTTGNGWKNLSGVGAVGALCFATSLTSEFVWNQTTLQYELARTR